MDNWCKAEQQKLKDSSQVMPNGCQLWLKGPDPQKCAYGKKRTKFPDVPGSSGVSEVVYVHRLAYMVSNKVVQLPQGLEVSHLCHNPRCVEPRHLCLESHEANSERITCLKQGICTKLHNPPCIIVNPVH